MNTTQKIITSSTVIFMILFACTNKEIKLVTNVELDFEQSHTNEGFVKELLPATFTITPEAFLEEFTYYFQYEVLEGQGIFLDSQDQIVPEGEPIILERQNEGDQNFSLNLNYQAQNSGTHRVRVTASDNFEKSFSQNLTYTIEDIPVVWELTSTITEADEQEEIPLTLTLQQKTADPGISYQVRYTFNEGSGQLLDATGATITLNRLTPITEGTLNLTFIGNQIGTNTLQAELLDSNGQTIPTTISFTILELDREPPVITLIGADPLVLLTGTAYTDPGVNLTDNRDTPEQLQENLVVDSSEVDTSLPGEYIVTYTVTDSSDNTQTATRTVRIEINTTDVPFFAVKGNASNAIETFTTALELGATYELGSLDGLTDNGTIVDQGIEDTNGIGGTTPATGTYTIRYFATDNDDNTTAIVETVVVADTTPPSFRINGRENDFETPWIAGDVYNARAFEAITDASTTETSVTTNPANILGTTLTTGTYTITYRVEDAVGLFTTLVETVIVTDGQAPTFEVRNSNLTPPSIETTDFETTLEFGTSYQEGIIQNIQDNSGAANTTQEIIYASGTSIDNTVPAIQNTPYSITYRVTDQENNATEITEEVTVVDTTAPTFSVQQNGQNYTTDFETTIDFGGTYTPGVITSANDLSGVTENSTGVNVVDTTTEGTYTVTYTVTDQSPNANVTTIMETINVGPDNQAPTAVIDVQPGLNGVAPYTVTLDGTGSSDPDAGDTLTYLWDLGGGMLNTNSTVPLNNLSEGSYRVSLVVTDQKGLSSDSVSVTITVSANQPPTFNVKGNTADFQTTLNAGQLYTIGTFTEIQDENITTVNTATSGATNLNGTDLCFSNNNAQITYTATDEQNATAQIVETIVVTDTQNPVITPPGSTIVEIVRDQSYTPPVLTISDNDPCINTTNATRTGTVNNTILGSNTLTYTATDANSNTAAPVDITVNVVNQNPVANPDDDNYSLFTNSSLNIPVLTNDNDPDSADTISINSITQPTSGGSVEINGDQIRFNSNTQIGSTSFTYTIKDQNGGVSTPATVNVTVNKIPLNVTLSASPTSGTRPLTVTFTATVTNNSGGIIYSWTGGGSGSSITRTYNTAGSKTVTVTVTSGGETESASRTVTVNDPIIDPDPCGTAEEIDCIDSGGTWCANICACASNPGPPCPQ